MEKLEKTQKTETSNLPVFYDRYQQAAGRRGENATRNRGFCSLSSERLGYYTYRCQQPRSPPKGDAVRHLSGKAPSEEPPEASQRRPNSMPVGAVAPCAGALSMRTGPPGLTNSARKRGLAASRLFPVFSSYCSAAATTSVRAWPLGEDFRRCQNENKIIKQA